MDAIDRGLRTLLGPSYGAGCRLDDPEVTAAYPPTAATREELARYRRAIAGDDDLWAAHVGGDVNAFPQLRVSGTLKSLSGERLLIDYQSLFETY